MSDPNDAWKWDLISAADRIQELEQRLKDKDQQLLEENLQVKRLEQQLAECKLDLRMAITKEQDLVDAEIEIVNLKAQNAKLVEALEKIADWNNTTAAEFAAKALKEME